MICHSKDCDEVSNRFKEALRAVNMENDSYASASWLNLSISGIGKALDVKRLGGIVPCRSLWGKVGNALAAVLVFDSRKKE
jgi:hypothetical protein